MKKYLAFLKIRFINGLQYRAAAAAGVATQFAWGFMEIAIFAVFWRENPAAMPMNISQLSSYIWLQQAFLTLFFIWFVDNEILNSITSGNIAFEMVRPLDIYSMWFTKNVATRLSRVVLRCFPILIFAVFLPEPYCLSAPVSANAFLLFLISSTLGFAVSISICMIIYTTTFFTMSPLGVRIIVTNISDLLSGSLIPIPFFPPALQAFAEITPFAAMQNLPFRIYVGNVTGNEIQKGIFLQIFWIFVLIVIGKLLMKRALRRVVVQGG